MTERQHSNLFKANLFSTVLTWIAALVVIATGFYYNTNSSLASSQKEDQRLEALIREKADQKTMDETIRRLDEKMNMMIELLKERKESK